MNSTGFPLKNLIMDMPALPAQVFDYAMLITTKKYGKNLKLLKIFESSKSPKEWLLDLLHSTPSSSKLDIFI